MYETATVFSTATATNYGLRATLFVAVLCVTGYFMATLHDQETPPSIFRKNQDVKYCALYAKEIHHTNNLINCGNLKHSYELICLS